MNDETFSFQKQAVSSLSHSKSMVLDVIKEKKTKTSLQFPHTGNMVQDLAIKQYMIERSK